LTVAKRARELKSSLLSKTKEIQNYFANSKFNRVIEGEGKIGIITSGVSYLHTMESLEKLGLKVPILKIGTIHPLPEKIIPDFIKNLESVIVIEELSPFLENEIIIQSKKIKPSLKIFGKRNGYFSEAFEYTVPIVIKALGKILEVETPDYEKFEKFDEELEDIPNRSPVFCAGCPHRGTFWALRQSIRKIGEENVVFNNDIGCYSMMQLEPNKWSDSMLCMGASLGISNGMQYCLEDKVLAAVGDSTFYHSAIPGLINAVHHNSNLTILILENCVTAMTGQQPNPVSNYSSMNKEAKPIDIESIVRAIGVTDVVTIDPYYPRKSVEKIKTVIDKKGVSVIISKRACALHNDRNKRRRGEKIIPMRVDPDKCKKIYACIRDFYCPAITINEETKQAMIEEDLCDGCGECSQVCPAIAIKSTEGVKND
ncbi:MAG: thiamine pyrophosphate-dependent enzyme, partial [Candidatus Ranarchaeia archaeon]